MLYLRTLILIFICTPTLVVAQVGIGTPTPSSKLEVIGAGTTSATTALKVGSVSSTILTVRNDGQVEISSTTQGFLPPRMTLTQREAISNPVPGLIVYCTNWDNNGELQIYNGSTWTNMIGGTRRFVIGVSYGGGILAYILQPGDSGYDANVLHGLIATAADISTGAQWGCVGTTISGAQGEAIGTGNQNTIAIMNGCGTSGIAARLCGDLVQGGDSDWYLPSKDELNKLYLNRIAIGGFTSFNYWSSSEPNSSINAWYHYFVDGSPYFGPKENALRVRVIRAF
jgi:hypothetical protein